MNIKNLFRLPELLLLFCILLPLVIIGNATLDIHLHDTYYVIDGSFLFLLFPVMLFPSWLLHLLLSHKGLLSTKGRWAHVGMTTLCSILFIVSFSFPTRPTRYMDYDGTFFSPFLTMLPVISLMTLVACQLIFWILTGILLIKSRRLIKG
jgi:hypothetical protein